MLCPAPPGAHVAPQETGLSQIRQTQELDARILFDGRTPRAAFRRIVLKKSGRPHRAFRRWLEGGGLQTSITLAPGVFDTTGRATALAQYRLERNAALRPDDDVVVLVLYAADGRLTDLHRYPIFAFSEAGYRVVLVVNSAAFHRDAGALDSPASLVIIRENIGFDFGAWAYAVHVISGLARVRSVTFTNDSLLPDQPPAGPDAHPDP